MMISLTILPRLSFVHGESGKFADLMAPEQHNRAFLNEDYDVINPGGKGQWILARFDVFFLRKYADILKKKFPTDPEIVPSLFSPHSMVFSLLLMAMMR